MLACRLPPRPGLRIEIFAGTANSASPVAAISLALRSAFPDTPLDFPARHSGGLAEGVDLATSA